MITLGVDLATDPRRTATCLIDWGAGEAPGRIVSMSVGAVDGQILEAARLADVVAIDAPFGWPRPWAEAVSQFRPGLDFNAAGAPSVLTMRETDRWVAATAGVRPLAVAANLIGATAIRCARLAHATGLAVDVGVSPARPYVCEVYPAAALRIWGLSHRLYKGKQLAEARSKLVGELVGAGLPIGLSPADEEVVKRSDDSLDALVCCLVGRASALGLTEDAPVHLQSSAAMEGWIRLPRPGSSLTELGAGG